MDAPSYHTPVMLREVLEALAIRPGGTYVDATLGGGGHAAAIAENLGGGGCLFAFDADPGAIEYSATHLTRDANPVVIIRQAYFAEGVEMLGVEGVRPDGVLMDLGVSSRQLDSDQIGLSYRHEMPLDMRFRKDADRPSARTLVETLPAGELATLLRRYGEEPAAWKIANAIVHGRGGGISTTTDLREIIEGVIPQPFQTKTLARVFQALRIAVNNEMEELERGLDGYIDLLAPGGRIVVLTYHSLEDRIVKERFRNAERGCTCPPELPVCVCGGKRRLKVVHRKPLSPSSEEIHRNPRARSARLRAAERVDDQ